MQILEKDGKAAFAILPIEEYQALLEAQEELNDIKDSKAILKSPERVPSNIVDALLDGVNPIKVWRKHRGVSQKNLAKNIEISPAYLSQIEKGERNGSVLVLRKIAAALKVDLDDLD